MKEYSFIPISSKKGTLVKEGIYANNEV